MFNNANVLFRTKFVDGVSTVARYAQSKPGKGPSAPLPLSSTGDASEETRSRKKRAKV